MKNRHIWLTAVAGKLSWKMSYDLFCYRAASGVPNAVEAKAFIWQFSAGGHEEGSPNSEKSS
jgi:hypothetical protein